MFKIKRTTQMLQVLKAYAKRVTLDESTGSLKYDYSGTNTGLNYESIILKAPSGKIVLPSDTPLSLGLEDGDELSTSYKKSTENDQIVNISVVGVGMKTNGTGDNMFFKLRMNTNMKRVYAAYAKKKGLDLSKLSFSTGEKGNIHLEKNTPKTLNLQNGDSIIAKYQDDSKTLARRTSNPMYNICKEGEGNRSDGNATSTSIDIGRQKLRLNKILRELAQDHEKMRLGQLCDFPKLSCSVCGERMPELVSATERSRPDGKHKLSWYVLSLLSFSLSLPIPHSHLSISSIPIQVL